MQINKAWCYCKALGIDFTGGYFTSEVTNKCDGVAIDCDVGNVPVTTGAIDNKSVANNEIMCHVSPLIAVL